MPTGVYFRPNAKPKCPKCKGTGIDFVSDIRIYKNSPRECGYYQPCACKYNMLKLKGNDHSKELKVC